MYTSSVGIIITLSVVRTILSVVNIYSDGCMHIRISCTYYSISCKHFAKFMSVTPSVVGTSYCISCTHYSSCTHCSVGCMPYSVSCVHCSVKLWNDPGVISLWATKGACHLFLVSGTLLTVQLDFFLICSIPVLYWLICMVWMVCGLEGPGVQFKGPSDVTVIMWMHMQVMQQSLLYIRFASTGNSGTQLLH